MTSEADVVTISFFILVLLWLVSLSFFVFRSLRHYNSVFKGSDKKGLQNTLESLLKDMHMSQQKLSQLHERLSQQEKEAQYKIQKMSLTRFNPFADTGGEQSFIIGLFDKKDNGMVLTSLQGRNGTRWYAKTVKNGKGADFALSKEEEEAVKKSELLS